MYRARGEARKEGERQNRSIKHAREQDGWNCPCSIRHEENLATFILKENYQTIMSSHHIIFKIRYGVTEPRNADGKLAWTTGSSVVRSEKCRLTLCYKTKDNYLREESLPICSLEICEPSLQEDAIVIEGEGQGTVVHPLQWLRKDGRRTGLYCKRSKEQRKKDAVLYPTEALVRARRLEDGPPIRD